MVKNNPELGSELSPDALFANIRSVGSSAEWSEEDYLLVDSAYLTASELHKDDEHRGKPYIYHLLENARILVENFHIDDPRVIVASIFHDSVEDHPRKFLKALGGVEDGDMPEDPNDRVYQGIVVMKELFTELTSVLVAGMTRPVKRQLGDEFSENEKKEIHLQDYVKFVTKESEVPLVWMLKFADWVHNGVGIVNSEKDIKPEKLIERRRKYFKLMEVLKARFDRGDMHQILAEDTIMFIEEQFRLGAERLTESGVDPKRGMGKKAISDTQTA